MSYTVEYTQPLKRKILPHETWINPEDIMLNKISQIQNGKSCVTVPTGNI